MAYKVIVQPRAEADLATALLYLSERSPEAASRWYRGVIDGMESLSAMPERCALAPEASKLGVEIRHLLHGKRPGIYRIVFRVLEAQREVHVLTVRHGARKPLTAEEVLPFMELE